MLFCSGRGRLVGVIPRYLKFNRYWGGGKLGIGIKLSFPNSLSLAGTQKAPSQRCLATPISLSRYDR